MAALGMDEFDCRRCVIKLRLVWIVYDDANFTIDTHYVRCETPMGVLLAALDKLERDELGNVDNSLVPDFF